VHSARQRLSSQRTAFRSSSKRRIFQDPCSELSAYVSWRQQARGGLFQESIPLHEYKRLSIASRRTPFPCGFEGGEPLEKRWGGGFGGADECPATGSVERTARSKHRPGKVQILFPSRSTWHKEGHIGSWTQNRADQRCHPEVVEDPLGFWDCLLLGLGEAAAQPRNSFPRPSPHCYHTVKALRGSSNAAPPENYWNTEGRGEGQKQLSSIPISSRLFTATVADSMPSGTCHPTWEGCSAFVTSRENSVVHPRPIFFHIGKRTLLNSFQP